MSENYAITINNKRIFDFVKNNPAIDLETLNLLMIDFIEKINTDMNKTLVNTINKEILNSVKQLETKLQDANSKYVENIKTTIQLNSNKESEKITTLLNKNTQEFAEKLNNFSSNSHDKFKDSLNQINSSTINELKDHISKNSGNKEFMNTFETKLQDIQKPMYAFFNNQQEQLIKKLAENDSDKNTMTKLTDFLNKWTNSSTHKGNYGQNMLEGVLNSAYPSAEIVNTSGLKASGDFMLKRESKPTIMVENKDYKSNVNADEVKKLLEC